MFFISQGANYKKGFPYLGKPLKLMDFSAFI